MTTNWNRVSIFLIRNVNAIINANALAGCHGPEWYRSLLLSRTILQQRASRGAAI